ncbi:MAG: hypothetical protein HZA66_19180 [Rhodopseudomonas palustris]|uniref:Uncharacterized protein n=1 Tax=Rhodopseudomonas palustris TaxID=1076 RepID=A0A933S2X9_RHOPL|nr:hypothetical protein [Rhodopseudomonas palustris]
MRSKSLLTNEPKAAVGTMAELYAIAFEQAVTAARRYGKFAVIESTDTLEPVRFIFEALERDALQCAHEISLSCVAELSKLPDVTQLNWAPTDLIPAEELLELACSSLMTPYLVWALAVRHRERGFVFWTYIAAHAERSAVRAAAEDMAREALNGANELRRERRLAWRSERHVHGEQLADGNSDIPLAALLESLLQKDIIEWARALPLVVRRHLLAATGNDVDAPTPGSAQASGTIDARRRAIRRAEQLSSIYLDEADHAGDQDQLELTQKLAARAITRLAYMRTISATLAE